MISNDLKSSHGSSSWLKGLFGGAIGLIALGSSMVAILDYFNVKPFPHTQGSLAMISSATPDIAPEQDSVRPTVQPTLTQEFPTVQPTLEPTILPTFTSQPTATLSPSPPPKPDAVAFVLSYWDNVSNQRYESAWAQLSPQFRQKLHNNSYEDYVQGYRGMSLCGIVVSNPYLVGQDDFQAVVTAHFTYYTGARCISSEYNFEMLLTYDPGSNSWLFDKNTVR
jgi:hypothetical protein